MNSSLEVERKKNVLSPVLKSAGVRAFQHFACSSYSFLKQKSVAYKNLVKTLQPHTVVYLRSASNC